MRKPAIPESYGLVAIPARLSSTRLPNKLLLRETGKPVLAHVVERAQEAVRLSGGLLTEVIVACDHPQLLAVALEYGAHGIMTSTSHVCGTTRIAEAVAKLEFESAAQSACGRCGLDFIVNVQADEPELKPQAIVRVAEILVADPGSQMATLAVAMPVGTESEKSNPNAVKVVIDARGRALYFSRCPIPHDRSPPSAVDSLWHHHLGIYAYRREFLHRFAQLPVSPLEKRESLEQLRAIEAGYLIRVEVVPSEWAGKGIDTPEDYAAFVRRCAA
jgi:3-deoxy-manno-octulosonate cytidylyltransferase (CMP-KDO synthetase)